MKGVLVLTGALLLALGCSHESCPCTLTLIPGWPEASPEELELVYLINDYRQEEGLAPLTPSRSLFAAAHRQAWDIQESRLALGHDGSDGSTMSQRAYEAGYPAVCVGETAHGAWDCGFTSPLCVLEDWQWSSPHDHIVLDEAYQAIGVGIHGGVTIADFGCAPPPDPL